MRRSIRIWLLTIILIFGFAGCNLSNTNIVDGEEKVVPITSVPDSETSTSTTTVMITALDYVNCRYGPSTFYEVIGSLEHGLSAPIIGRNADSTWWLIKTLDASGKCWIYDGVVEVNGDTGQIPVVNAPPTPTFTSPEP